MAIDTTNLVKFSRGNLAGYYALVSENKINNNTVYITQDEGGIYLGDKRLGDYIKVDNIAALQNLSIKSVNALYYAETENVLARWKPDNASQPNGTGKWVQINAAGLVSVDDSATGNVVTGIEVSTNDKGERILKTKKSSMATSSEFNTLSQQVTQIEAAYKKADTDLETKLKGNSNSEAGSDTISGANKAAAAAAAAAKTADDKAVAAQGTADSALAKANTNASAITALDAAYKAADTALEKKLAAGTGGDSTFATGTYKNINTLSAAIVANENTLTNHEERIFGNSGEISTLKSQMTTANTDISGLQTSVNNLNSLMTGDGNGSVNKRLADLKKEILTGDSNDTLGQTYDTLLEISNWITTHGQAATDLTGRVATVEGKVDKNTQAITALQAEDGTIKNSISNMDAAYKAADLQIRKDLLGTTDGTATGIAYATIKKLSEQVKATEGNITSHGSKISAIESNITTLQAKDTALEESISAMGTAYVAADTALKKAIVGTADGSNTGLDYGTIKALSDQVKVHDGNISTINGNISTINTSITSITTQLTWGTF